MIKLILVGSIFTTGRNDKEWILMYLLEMQLIYIVFTQRERAKMIRDRINKERRGIEPEPAERRDEEVCL